MIATIRQSITRRLRDAHPAIADAHAWRVEPGAQYYATVDERDWRTRYTVALRRVGVYVEAHVCVPAGEARYRWPAHSPSATVWTWRANELASMICGEVSPWDRRVLL